MKVIHDWLQIWSTHSPQRIALIDGDSHEAWSYSVFFKKAKAAAGFLVKNFRIKKGDRIIYVGQNNLSVINLFFSVSRLGAILVPVNYRLTAKELSYIFKDADPQLVVHDSEVEALLKETFTEVGCFKPTLNISELQKNSENTEGFSEFLAEENDPAMIIYTSGTTGRPKGAMISHGGLFWNSISTSMRLNITQNDVAVTFLPLFHTGGWNVLTTPFFSRGACIILTQKFVADQILSLSEKYQATLLFGVPTTMALMAQSSKFQSSELSTIRYAIVGGEPLSLDLIQVWNQKNIPVRQGYGLTEFGPNVFSLNETDSVRKMGSVGFANAYIETKVVDEKGQNVQANQIGELWLRGPACMLGYWNHPEATQQTFQGDWLKTGDLVRQDSEGFFYIVGRQKDMFKSGGENVYPAEVEQVISQLTWVKEVAVIGVPDEKWGESGVAYVSSEKKDFNTEQLREHCSKNLAKFKIPKSFLWIQELPKSGAGKVLKRELGTSR